MSALALFDFDGTITSKDSLADFVRYSVGGPAYFKGLLALSPLLVEYLLRIIPNDIAKEKFVAYFFKGWDIEDFDAVAYRYALERIDEIIRPRAMQRIRWHKQKGHRVVIVSASMQNWLRTWCKNNDLDLIATQLEVKDGKLTGKFATANCYGAEKVRRAMETFKLDSYDFIYAYGDSRGDRELLALADESFYKPFRK